MITSIPGVHYSLSSNPNLFDVSVATLNLIVHVDGLPLFQSSPMQFWPILGCIDNNPVFIIGLYKGAKKPTSRDDFLKKLLHEIIPYFSEGLKINGKTYDFKLKCVLADAPARAFLLGMTYHSGFFSCSKCIARGVRSEGRVCFPIVDEEIPKR